MVYPGALPSPGANTTTYSSQDDYSNPDLGSMIDSFQSPGHDGNILGGHGKRGGGKITVATPQRQPFRSLANRNAGQNEFTPLLKSVHRSAMKSKIGGVFDNGVPMPEFLKPGGRLPSSPALPEGSPDATEDYTRDEDTISPAAALDSSAVGSTPLAPRTGGGGGAPLGGDGLMTLREQEKVIDDIKKENFSLKLKVFFLNERLEKLGPEHNDAALKEVGNVCILADMVGWWSGLTMDIQNVEIKVERATLKAELKRYKKSLLDSEKAVAELRQELSRTGKDRDDNYTSARRSEEEARLREELQAKLENVQTELEQALDEVEHLRDNDEKLRKHIADLESDEVEDVAKLQHDIEALEDEKGDLEAELREKERQLDEREEQFEKLEDDLKAKDEKIADLEEHAGDLMEQINELKTERDGEIGGKDQLLEQKDEALRAAERRIKELERVCVPRHDSGFRPTDV
jgi:hypothetical protein